MATETQGEHSFEIEVLISGEAISGYTAGEALSAGEPVALTGDYTVTAATDGGPAFGLVAYDVASGEEVSIITCDGNNEANIEVSEAVNAGEELTPDGLGTVRQTVGADPDVSLAIANNSASAGEVVEARLVEQSGVTA